MALPLAPVAVTALKYATVATLAYVAVRNLPRGRIDQRAEDALDEMSEGVTLTRPADRDQMNASGRFRRILRLGPDGPGIEVDLSGLARFRVRRV